jgi:hypothetical protein
MRCALAVLTISGMQTYIDRRGRQDLGHGLRLCRTRLADNLGAELDVLQDAINEQRSLSSVDL